MAKYPGGRNGRCITELMASVFAEKFNAGDASGFLDLYAEVQRRGADGKWRFTIDDSGGGSRG
jgi:hypothetical protein